MVPENSLFQLSCVGGACKHSFAFSLARQEADESTETEEDKNLAIWLLSYII